MSVETPGPEQYSVGNGLERFPLTQVTREDHQGDVEAAPEQAHFLKEPVVWVREASEKLSTWIDKINPQTGDMTPRQTAYLAMLGLDVHAPISDQLNPLYTQIRMDLRPDENDENTTLRASDEIIRRLIDMDETQRTLALADLPKITAAFGSKSSEIERRIRIAVAEERLKHAHQEREETREQGKQESLEEVLSPGELLKELSEGEELSEKTTHRKKSQFRLIRALMSPFFQRELHGKNLEAIINSGEPVIYLFNHGGPFATNLANGIAAFAEIGVPVKLVEASTHEHLSQNFGGYFSRKIIGENNTLSIHFTGKPKEKKNQEGEKTKYKQGDGAGLLDPEDYPPMKKALEDGFSIVIAGEYNEKEAHAPRAGEQSLKAEQGKSTRGGVGAVYLAQVAGKTGEEGARIPVPIVPVFVTKEPVREGDSLTQRIIKKLRPTMRITIGEPIHLDPIEGIETFPDLLNKRGTLPEEEERQENRMEIRGKHTALRHESKIVMAALGKLADQESTELSTDHETDAS